MEENVKTVYEPAPVKKLTRKQRRFTQNYLANGGNATQAAADAGYGGSRHSLAVIGKDNLKVPEIAATIEADMDAHGLTTAFILDKLFQIASMPIDKTIKVSYKGNQIEAVCDPSTILKAIQTAIGMRKIDGRATPSDAYNDGDVIVRELHYVNPYGKP